MLEGRGHWTVIYIVTRYQTMGCCLMLKCLCGNQIKKTYTTAHAIQNREGGDIELFNTMVPKFKLYFLYSRKAFYKPVR